MSEINFNVKKSIQYEDMARKAVFGYDQLFVLALAAMSDKDMMDILVVGSGTGKELITFGTLKESWTLTGVDPSSEMVNVSKANLEKNKLNDRVKLFNGFVDELPEEKKYDAATLIFVLRFIQDDFEKLVLLKNISKRLKPGAKFILVDQFGDPANESFKDSVANWKKFIMLNGVSAELQNKITDQALKQSIITETRVKELLTEAGFYKISTFYQSFIHMGFVVQKMD